MDAQPGLLSGLTDLSFEKFVTPKIIKLIYVVVLIFSAITYLGYTIFAFQVTPALGVLVLIVIGPLAFLLTAILWRMTLELAIAIFKIAENTSRVAQPASTSAAAPISFDPPSSRPPPLT